MYEMLVKNYLKNLTKNDLIYFALKNNINLNDNEVDYVYQCIKTRYQELLSDNYLNVFLDGKSHLTEINYQKLYELYKFYYNKYKGLL